MKYIYTSNNCWKCEALKTKFIGEGVDFEERPSERLTKVEDEVDREALVQASLQNMELPVEIDV